MLTRSAHATTVATLLDAFPVVAILGARQVGKSTLARQLASQVPEATRFDLEDPRDLSRLAEPMLALEPLNGLIILDEIQHRPDIFPVLRVLADRPGKPARFLVLGSASPALLRQSSESLAGRIAYHELGGFDLGELGESECERLWLRGGFPVAFLAPSDAESSTWRRAFTRTYAERDLPLLGVRLPAATVRRFWTMLAHYHGQLWNGSELARAFGVTEKTVRHYLDVLCATFMARRLDPWFDNLGKRTVKSPKVYVTDSGLLHTLLGIETRDDLLGHPKVGASFEGFAIREVTLRLGARPEECFFWALHSGAELDLLVARGQRRLGFEVKHTDSPRITPSMRSAIQALGLERLDVVHAGADTYALGDKVRALAIRHLLSNLEPL